MFAISDDFQQVLANIELIPNDVWCRLYDVMIFWYSLDVLYSSQMLQAIKKTGRGSLIGSEFAWHASGPEFDPHVRHILSWRLGHENISTAILPLPLIQEEQLSVSGERMCTKYW